MNSERCMETTMGLSEYAQILKELHIPEKEKYIFTRERSTGRSFETLIPAFNEINSGFDSGRWEFHETGQKLTEENGLTGKVAFLGRLLPDQLYDYHSCLDRATLFKNKGLVIIIHYYPF